jgi:hypothetical protein
MGKKWEGDGRGLLQRTAEAQSHGKNKEQSDNSVEI